MRPNREALLTDLLKAVSRSFYLTLRVLPAAVRSQIGLAYLLARATDTVADTELLPVAERLSALARLRQRIVGESIVPLAFQRIAEAQPQRAGGGSNAERVLLERIEEALALLEECSRADRLLIRSVLETITSGQQLDLERFGAASEGRICALTSRAELDDYTYHVAGCVGEFWTKMCRMHLFPEARLDDGELLARGVRFGKGLQLVNILRDVPNDLRQGRCYIPSDQLKAAGLEPKDLLDPGNEQKLRPIYDPLLSTAREHLMEGWKYTNSLPRSCRRVRLACAWPILIGVRTVALLRSGSVLNPHHRIKVARPDVRRLIVQSVVWSPFPQRWSRLFSVAESRI